MDREMLVVARVGRAHGLRGEVTVELHTDDPGGRFVPGAVFATQARAGSGVPVELTLASARRHRETWLLGFVEVPDRTGAEGLRGTRLLAEADEGAPEDDAWYEDDLVGLVAVSPSGETLGEVVGLEVGPGQDRLLLRLTDGSPALVPLVAAIVPEVDVETRRVVVDAPRGLLDLGRPGPEA